MVRRGRGVGGWGGADEGDSTLYYSQDANFNVTALVDTSGAVVERYLYDPYGKVTVLNADWSADEDGQSDVANEILFTGHRLDGESGLYYTLWRYYHPTLGRWLQRDPEGYVDGMSLYEYCTGGPVDAQDATGFGQGYQDQLAFRYLMKDLDGMARAQVGGERISRS